MSIIANDEHYNIASYMNGIWKSALRNIFRKILECFYFQKRTKLYTIKLQCINFIEPFMILMKFLNLLWKCLFYGIPDLITTFFIDSRFCLTWKKCYNPFNSIHFLDLFVHHIKTFRYSADVYESFYIVSVLFWFFVFDFYFVGISSLSVWQAKKWMKILPVG